ncbi:MAG TPA: bacterial transcriptional activator domain-containing protein [Actinomycetes bacterium]|jgi:DNA-binding SARP family transcriptional activator|nr:bacterial transcriptional activator domain-containing protein [Actinomycetes bacterium]
MPWLDTEAFDAACRRARQTRDSQDYRTAAELYRGDLLPEDRFEDWAEGPREALRERHLGLLVEYADVLSARGEHTQVVDIVGAVTAADPFHEGAYRTLMTALAASARRNEAGATVRRPARGRPLPGRGAAPLCRPGRRAGPRLPGLPR